MDLSGLFITKTQATEFIQRISRVVDTLYTANFDLEKILAEQLGLQKKDRLMKLFFENNINTGDKDAVRDFLQKIITAATAIPTVELTLAFEPTEEILMSLSQWFMMQLKKQAIFAVKVDYSLIGGAIITFNGKYKDCSLKSVFEKVISAGTTPASARTTAPVSATPQPEDIHQRAEYIEIGR